MCGIIGYIGTKKPKEVIYKGLKTLEYRGYDSAGVAIYNKDKFERVRAQGKLINLKEKLEHTEFNGNIGIGHTRWATHGKPTEVNAHPHEAGDITIVHNGIIENYQDIREELLRSGCKVETETDSELIAHLLDKEVKKGVDLRQAVLNIIKNLEGAYSIVAVNKKNPKHIVAFKHGPPLVLGLGDTEFVLASDVQAILPHTRKVIYLNDFEVCDVNQNSYQIVDLHNKEVDKEVVKITWNADVAEKQGYPHFMLKEIYEQPRVLAQAIAPHINIDKQSIELTGIGYSGTNEDQVHKALKDFSEVERIFVIACGTSFYAGLYGEYLIENFAKLPVECELASEFRYRNPVVPPNSLAIVISQSGETADSLAALKIIKKQGAKVLSICNVPSSSIDRDSDYHLYMNADVEIGVASTKALIASMALLNIFGLFVAKSKKLLDVDEERQQLRAMQALPSALEKVLNYDSYFAEAAKQLKTYKGFLYIGRGVSYPVALEGALKLKELAYMHAEGYAAGEMKHGPIALIDKDMVVMVVAPDDDVFEKTLSNLEEVKARGGNIISIGTGDNHKLKLVSDRYLGLPKSLWNLNSILSVIPLQLMALHVADQLGLDVDQPRNLAKSVTVE